MDNNPLHTTASSRNLGPAFLGIDWAVFSVSTIVVVLRLYTRLCITRNFWLDDAVIALTQVLSSHWLCRYMCAYRMTTDDYSRR